MGSRDTAETQTEKPLNLYENSSAARDVWHPVPENYQHIPGTGGYSISKPGWFTTDYLEVADDGRITNVGTGGFETSRIGGALADYNKGQENNLAGFVNKFGNNPQTYGWIGGKISNLAAMARGTERPLSQAPIIPASISFDDSYFRKYRRRRKNVPWGEEEMP